MPNKRVAVAMSGGVDSSLTAALLQEADYEVIGVTMQIWPSDKQAFGSCCGVEAVKRQNESPISWGFPTM